MKKYEYISVQVKEGENLLDVLNRYGGDGWLIVHIGEFYETSGEMLPKRNENWVRDLIFVVVLEPKNLKL